MNFLQIYFLIWFVNKTTIQLKQNLFPPRRQFESKMVKLRKTKMFKNQNDQDVKLENQSQEKNDQSSSQSDIPENNTYDEKQLDEEKIIKEFLMKRKLLMKALKQKQKEKNPKLLTFEIFQNNEGYSKNYQNTPKSKNSSNEQQIFQNQSSQNNQTNTKFHQGTNSFKIDVAIQTNNLNKKKYLTKICSNKANPEQYIFDCLIQDKKSDQKNKHQLLYQPPFTKKKNGKDIQKIKNQINKLFNQQNGYQTIENKKNKNFTQQSYESQTKNRQFSYNSILTVTNELNEQISRYYSSKSLNKIIVNQFKSKVNQIIRKRQSIKKMSTDKNKNKQKKIKKDNTHEYLSFQTQKIESKATKKRSYLSKKTEKNKIKKFIPSRKIINERFKNVLTLDNDKKNKKMNFIEEPMDQQQKCYFQREENNQQTQFQFDPMDQWNNEFTQIKQMLLEKYTFLNDYLTERKQVDYKNIYNSIRLGGKQISIENSSQIKTSTEQSHSQIDFLSTINIKKKIKHKNSKQIQKSNSFNRLKINKKQFFKQLQMDIKEQDDFGKSFDLYQGPERNNETNPTFFEINKSNILSNPFNSSFYTESMHKKSEQNSQQNSRNFNLSFLSQSKKSTNQQHQQQIEIDAFSNKTAKKNQKSFSKCSSGKQYFYMSQQMI